jgi:hypothetical protein
MIPLHSLTHTHILIFKYIVFNEEKLLKFSNQINRDNDGKTLI